jgi:hypothetical protein
MLSETIQVRCSRVDIDQLLTSTLWKDIVDELEAWKLGFNNELLSLVNDIAKNNPSTASVLTHLGEINGCIKSVDYLLALPEMFKDILEDREKDRFESKQTGGKK